MTDIEKILFTSFFTVLSGVLVFIVGQIFLKHIIDPIYYQKKIIGKISFSLTHFANIIHNPIGDEIEKARQKGNVDILEEKIDHYMKASLEIRKLASEIFSTIYTIPMYDIFAKYGLTINRENIKTASSNLIGISNFVFSPNLGGKLFEQINENVQNIKDVLNINK